MAKGVKKIKLSEGCAYYPAMSVPEQRIAILAEQAAYFEISEWFDETTVEDKKKNITWMRQSYDRKIIINQLSFPSASKYALTLPKKLCGDYHYYIEASWSGKRDFNNDSGLYVRGFCEPRIISSKWSKENGGKNIKNKEKEDYISYGENIYLNLSTEGLNGDKLIIELWNQQFMRKDKHIFSYKDVQVIDGEVNLKIQNTYSWMVHVSNMQNIEEFYIKVRDQASGTYIKDNLGDELHAIYLNVKNEITTTNIDVSQNQTLTTIYKPDVNAARYEPCKFEVIKITESEIRDGKVHNTTVAVFDNGKGLRKTTGNLTREQIQRTIFFKFDSTIIDKCGETTLNNILKFLLEHRGSTMDLSGYACVIGRKNYNKTLSQRRADIVKKFFADGGLDMNRINSEGKGEVDPTDDKMGRDNLKYRNEKEYENNRRVDISFVFNGHDADTIVYEAIAPSVSAKMKKNLTIDITGLDSKMCFRGEDKHEDMVKIIDVGRAVDSGETERTFRSPSFNYNIYSNLSRFILYPLQYIWPLATSPNQFHLHIHSCRYFSNKKNTTVLINTYPDIKWELAVEFLVNVSNYKATNMPVGNIFAKHQEKSRKAGYKKWQINNSGKIPISIGLNLSAEWDNGEMKREFTTDFEDKMQLVANTIANSICILQRAVNFAQGAAKTTAIPISFDVRYPKCVIVGKWYLERINTQKTLSIIGEVGFGFKPLIGAEVLIDILGAAIALASYGATGNPAAAKLINEFKGGLEKLGASITFTATFYGELEIMVDALKIDSINGIDMQGKMTIGGKMGVAIELSLNIEIGKIKGTKTKPIITFKAAAKADAYFGGNIVIDSDKYGLFFEPVLKFSGVLLSIEIEGEAGWWKSNFKIETIIIKEETLHLEKHYFK